MKTADEIVPSKTLGPHNIGTIRAALMYHHWTDPDILTRQLFGDVSEYSLEKWRDRYRQGFFVYWHALDYDHQTAFMMLAMGEYGEEVRKWVTLNEDKRA